MVKGVEDVLKVVESVPLVDTHEHLQPEPDRLSGSQDPLRLFLWYVADDLSSAGITLDEWEEMVDPSRPWEERVAIFEAYWEYAKTTGYGQALRIALRDLYGVEDVNRRTFPKLVEALNACATPGFYRRILQRANIAKIVADYGDFPELTVEPKLDEDYFVLVRRYELFTFPRAWEDLYTVSRVVKTPVRNLSDLERALRGWVRETLPRYAGVKIGFPAYELSLKFEYATYSEAEYALKALIEGGSRVPQPSIDELKPLHSYLLRVLLQEAEAVGKPVQVHTGIQSWSAAEPKGARWYPYPGAWKHAHPVNAIGNANPTLLVNLFKEFASVRFVLFHAGYPYSREAGVLAKQYPNVFLDLCWVHEINPRAYEEILDEWLELVPSNKVMAFGGDYGHIEGTYGASRLARRGVAKVLQRKVEDGRWDVEDAVKVAWRILRTNAQKLFNLTLPPA
jgi:predicted TIM-barrel fold metal-dependent hydrolase